MAVQQADGGVIDFRRQHLLRAAGHQRDPLLPVPARRMQPLLVETACWRQLCRRHFQHRLQRAGKQILRRLRQLRAEQRGAKEHGARQHNAEHGPQEPVKERPLVGFLDIVAAMLHQMHIIDARRTGRHAGKAGKTAIEMLHGRGRGRFPAFQHLLHEIDAPARAIALISELQIGRAGRGAEAAMDAGAQDIVGSGNLRIGKLENGEFRFHIKPLPSYLYPHTCARD